MIMFSWLKDFLWRPVLRRRIERLIREAIDKNWCTKVFCTTCGSREFHNQFQLRFGLDSKQRSQYKAAKAIIKALRLVHCNPDWRWNECMNFIIFMLRRHAINEYHLLHQLEGSWAGDILKSRIRRDEKRQAASDAHEAFNHPDAIAARRAKKREEKQLKHEEHLKRQRERAIWWHQNNPPPAAKIKGA